MGRRRRAANNSKEIIKYRNWSVISASVGQNHMLYRIRSEGASSRYVVVLAKSGVVTLRWNVDSCPVRCLREDKGNEGQGQGVVVGAWGNDPTR